MKKKLLYLMHVPWGVMRHRPNFIAENLSKAFDVTVCSAKRYRDRRMFQNVTEEQLELRQLFVLPFGRLWLVSRMNELLVKLQLVRAIAKADIIWVTHPVMYATIKNVISADIKLVYDCMDDALEFPNVRADEVLKSKLFVLEKSLVRRCDAVIVSSDYLREKLIQRYGGKINSYVVNNAVTIPTFDQSQDGDDVLKFEALMDSLNGKKFLYIGSISEWMDFDLILKSLERLHDITYVFVGLGDVPIPYHDRIIFFGPLEHRYIFRAMKKADALIMPFYVNELIKSVNPVKVYEYIYSCKPAIVVNYSETKRFEDFVHLYSTAEEYLEKIEALSAGRLTLKKDEKEYLGFVAENTWRARAEKIICVLNSLE